MWARGGGTHLCHEEGQVGQGHLGEDHAHPGGGALCVVLCCVVCVYIKIKNKKTVVFERGGGVGVNRFVQSMAAPTHYPPTTHPPTHYPLPITHPLAVSSSPRARAAAYVCRSCSARGTRNWTSAITSDARPKPPPAVVGVLATSGRLLLGGVDGVEGGLK